MERRTLTGWVKVVSEGFEPRQQQSKDWKAGTSQGVVDYGQVASQDVESPMTTESKKKNKFGKCQRDMAI